MSKRFEPNPEGPITPNFLAEQISLPREAWSDEFKGYIAQKIQQNREHAETVPAGSREQEMKATFDRYTKGLDLSTHDLKGKVIFDLGSGDGEFVEKCIDDGVSDSVYGIDAREQHAADKYTDHFFKGSFEDPFPVKNLDYAISVGAISVFEGVIDRKKVFKNALFALKDGGEIRIYPIQKPPVDSDLQGLKDSYKRWSELMPEIVNEEGIQWELRPIDIRVAGTNNDVWLEEVLIIRKGSKQ